MRRSVPDYGRRPSRFFCACRRAPILVQRLAEEITPRLTFATPPRDLQDIVAAQGKRLDRIYHTLHGMVTPAELRPGPTLTALASIEKFPLFLSTTFDPLLWRAVESASAGGLAEERCRALSCRGASPDLPRAFETPGPPLVYQLFGKAQPVRDFVIWDDDALHFLLSLDKQFASLPNLATALNKRNLLVLGATLPDWLLRFFFHIVKRKAPDQLDESDLYVADCLKNSHRQRAVLFFDRVWKQVRVLPADPITFVDTLYTEWRKRHPAPPGDPYLMNKAHREKHGSPGCIFVSYASPDLEIARHVVAQLQKAGCLVWFDKEQISLGRDWKEVLREAVEERCGLFISLISGQTSARHNGYNIFERKLAARWRDLFADNEVFYLPMRIDDAEPLIPDNEPHGTKTIQGARHPGGHLDADIIGQIRDLQTRYCQAHGLPLPTPP